MEYPPLIQLMSSVQVVVLTSSAKALPPGGVKSGSCNTLCGSAADGWSCSEPNERINWPTLPESNQCVQGAVNSYRIRLVQCFVLMHASSAAHLHDDGSANVSRIVLLEADEGIGDWHIPIKGTSVSRRSVELWNRINNRIYKTNSVICWLTALKLSPK